MVGSIQSVLKIAAISLLASSPVSHLHQQSNHSDSRPAYRLPRNREINLFNEVGTRVWYAHMLVNPTYGTRSAYYGSDPDTVAHQLAPSAVGRYELKSTELVRIRLFDENPALLAPAEQRGREFLLQPGHNYRLVRLEDGGVAIWTLANTGIVEIRNEVSDDLTYDLVHLDSEGQEHRLTIDIAPRGINYHNVRGTIECLPGLPSQRRSNVPFATTVTAGRSYVLRLDPQGRMTATEGNWDLFPVESGENK